MFAALANRRLQPLGHVSIKADQILTPLPFGNKSFQSRCDPFHTPKLLAVTFITLVIVLMLPQIARAQNANADPPTASLDVNAQEHPYNGDDATRPLNLIQLRYTYKTAPGTTRSVITHTVTLRADRRIDLTPDWQLAFRTDLPALVTNPITSDNPEGHFLYGMGDAEFQAALIHDFNDRWAAGFGAKLIAPTGTDSLASRKWQVMPGASFRLNHLIFCEKHGGAEILPMLLSSITAPYASTDASHRPQFQRRHDAAGTFFRS
jgi:hypothetical protein